MTVNSQGECTTPRDPKICDKCPHDGLPKKLLTSDPKESGLYVEMKQKSDKQIVERIEQAFRMEKHHEEASTRSHKHHVEIAEILRPLIEKKMSCRASTIFYTHDSRTCPVCNLYKIAEIVVTEVERSYVYGDQS